jgi:hypothetical protein
MQFEQHLSRNVGLTSFLTTAAAAATTKPINDTKSCLFIACAQAAITFPILYLIETSRSNATHTYTFFFLPQIRYSDNNDRFLRRFTTTATARCISSVDKQRRRLLQTFATFCLPLRVMAIEQRLGAKSYQICELSAWLHTHLPNVRRRFTMNKLTIKCVFLQVGDCSSTSWPSGHRHV